MCTVSSCGTVRLRDTRRGACVCRVLCAELEVALSLCACLFTVVFERLGCEVGFVFVCVCVWALREICR